MGSKVNKPKVHISSFKKTKTLNHFFFVILVILTIIFLAPIFIVFMNSFKGQFYISETPFSLPTKETFVGISNYVKGMTKIGFEKAFFWSMFITISSVVTIVFFSSMTAWYITRVKSKFNNMLYYLFAFSMIVPFQMVMFTMSKVSNMARLDSPVGIIIIYLGFGSGLSVFMFSGFVKSIPLEIEEAAMIDGGNPIQTFFMVVLPILKPIAITVAILNTMWVWNDYLLPYLVLSNNSNCHTIFKRGIWFY